MAGKKAGTCSPKPSGASPARAGHHRGILKPEVRAQRIEKFLEVLRDGSTVARACDVAGLAYGTVYDWKAKDEAFARRWAEAYEVGTDSIEQEALRRAKDGVQRPIYQRGELVGHEIVYSDRLIELMLRARRPDQYRDRSTVEMELSGQAARLESRLEAARKRVKGDAPAPEGPPGDGQPLGSGENPTVLQ